MNSTDSLMDNISIEKNLEMKDEILSLIERLDFIDIQILRKFYMTGKEFPNDTQPYCFPLLYSELKNTHHFKIGIEALRKRLNKLVKMNLLVKVKHSNPTSYEPLRGKENFVRAIIIKFFMINGLMKFL
ncbi:MAG: hypothetical protein QXX07_00860 [Candidatus Aenigmatarchaeota archaeon]